MAGKIRVTPCPQCSKIGGLNIVIKFVTKSLPGKWSLAGAQAKVPAEQLPVLECEHCDFTLVGRFDGDSHVAFDKPKEENQWSH